MTDPSALNHRELHGPFSLTPADWRSVVKGVGATAERANLTLISAGVAFFGLMAVIPGLGAMAALVGVFGDLAWLGQQINALGGVAPDAMVTIIHEQVSRLLAGDNDTRVLGAVFNLACSL